MESTLNDSLPPGMPHSLSGSQRPLSSLRPCGGHLLRHRGYDIRPARTQDQHGMANMLVRRMYTWRGYVVGPDTPQLDDPDRITLAAWLFDTVVATLTLARDSSAGLLADALYGPELAGLRSPDRVICEVSRLAIDPDFTSPDLLSILFQTALKHAKDSFSASDAVIEINPRHASFYQRRFGFKQIGTRRHCSRVDAPAVFLHQELDNITHEALRAA